MRRVSKAAALLIAGAAMLSSSQAWAVSCGVTGQAQAATSITYDPFAASGLTQITVPLTLTRYASGGAKTQTVNFVLTTPVGSPRYEVLYNGASVVYTEGATGGHPVNGSRAAGEIYYSFGGASAPDQSTPFNLVVTVPANVNLSAGDPIKFDIQYVCAGTGGMTDVVTPTKLTGAIQINVNVLSALQASYVGPALDFGEVGLKTDLQVATDPGTKTGYIRVASSGPYSVEMRSQNGYRLTYPGGNPALAIQAMKYRASFLGQTRDATNTAAVTQICSRAGLDGTAPNQGIRIPLSVTLQEGGVGRLPAPNYQDALTVTLTPLFAPQNGVVCGAP